MYVYIYVYIYIYVYTAPVFFSQFENTYFTEMCSGSKAGSYLRLIDVFITQL